LARAKVDVCYNYGCIAEAQVTYADSQLAWARKTLASAKNAEQERIALSMVLGRLYFWAGAQSPIHADKGGNTADDAVHGAMDCIDHSTTTTRLLDMLARRGMLRYHRVLNPARRTRFFLFQHFSAVIEELPPRWLPPARARMPAEFEATEPENRFAVDSWFVNNGQPAVILPLDDWKNGAGPDIEPD
jgi:hypothetical protein